MRQTCLKMIEELAARDGRIFFIGSDLGAGVLEGFRKNHPDRFFMEGISEAHLIGMAAGLALDGKIPYVHTIATFLTRRCLEQVILDAGLHRLKIRLVGAGGGLVYAPLGPTHQAIDDFALMRVIPGMTILAPADAEEMKRLMPETVDSPGPVYIRLAKGGDPVVTKPQPFKIGRAYPMREGSDALLVATGVMLGPALKAAQTLEAAGTSAGVLHVPTVKPFDKELFLEKASLVQAVVSVEEHSIIGGLGSCVAEVLAENAMGLKFKRLGVPDVFAEGYGSQDELMAKYGLSAGHIVKAVTDLLEKP